MSSSQFITTTNLSRGVRLAICLAIAVISGMESALAGDIFNADGSTPGVFRAQPAAKGGPGVKAPTKLTLGLGTLSAEYQAYQRAVKSGAEPAGTFVTRATMAAVVDETVVIDAIASDDTEALIIALESLGAEVTAVAGRMVSVRLHLSLLPILEGIASLKFARPALAATRTGSVTSQGDPAQRSDLARTNFGIDGAGAKVGVLSDSFDCSGNGSYATDQASGDLPAGVNILDDSAPSCSDEGRAMAQIVYDVAPGASLAFHTAFNGEADFAQGILDLAAAGSTIIVDDVIYYTEPMFQDGIIAQAADQVVAAGIPYFSSAGNSARQSYEAPFRPSGVIVDFGFGPLELHDFDPGAGIDTWQQFSFNGNDVSFSFQWDQPFFSVSGAPGSASDIDICFSTTPSAVGLFGCAADANVGGDPVEIFALNGSTTFYFALAHFDGPFPDLMKYVWFRDAVSNLEYATNSPTSYGHANAAGVSSVGAAFYDNTPAFGVDPPLLEGFSSAGLIPILFDTAGNPVSELRQKPEFTAPDGGNNTFFGGSDPELDGFPNFFGTSAAAPHAAGVAALLQEIDPTVAPAAITMALQDTAIDILARDTGTATGAGYDNDSGSGLIDADAALAAIVQVDPIWLPSAAAQTNHTWTFVNAPSGFLDPVVIAGPPTFHGPDPGVVRLRNVTDLGFDLRFQEWDYRQRDFGDTSHAVEDIHYLVLLAGRHTLSDGSVWEIGTFNLSGTGVWQGVSFAQPFANPPRLLLTVQTYNGSQAAGVRARSLTANGFEAALFEEQALMDGHAVERIGYLAVHSPSGGGLVDLDGTPVPYLLQSLNADERWSPVLSQRVKVEEEQSLDNEVDHVDETLHVLAFGDQILAQQVSHNGGDTTALRRLEPTADAPMEWGLIRGIDHSWQTLPFAKSYHDPVLVAKPASNNGGDPGVIRLRNVTATDAELRYQEWNYLDGNHTTENVFYLVSEAGQHSLGGLTVEANLLVSNRLGRAGQWESILFNAFFLPPRPAVLASVMTYNGTDAVTTRIANLDLSGLNLAMDEQESKADGHTNEVLGWIAIEQNSGTTAEGRNVEIFFESLDHVLTPVLYPSATSHRYPTVVADVDSTFGADPVFLRYSSPINTQIELKLTEEQSADPETNHVSEDVGVFFGE